MSWAPSSVSQMLQGGSETRGGRGRYLVFSMTPICWLRSMSSISCFCRTLSRPLVRLMNTCWSRSSTFGLSSKSLIRHLPGRKEEESRGRFLGFIFKLNAVIFCQCKYLLFTNRSSSHTHLQMKSLKLSDQSSGWWRVGGGFLRKE